MFGLRYFARRFFGGRFFGNGGAEAPPVGSASVRLYNPDGASGQVVHDNGTDSTSSAAKGARTFGTLVTWRTVLDPDGGVALGRSYSGFAEDLSARSTPPEGGLATSWGEKRLYLGARSDGSGAANLAIRRLEVARGRRTFSDFGITLGIDPYPDPAFEYDAESGVFANANGTGSVADGGAVGSWVDGSINANRASQTTAGFRPTWVADATPSGKPALRFAAASTQYLDRTTLTQGDVAEPMTIFVVCRSSDVDRLGTVMGSKSLTKRRDIGLNARGQYTSWVTQGTTQPGLPGPDNPDQWVVVTATCDGANSYVRVNGAHVAGNPGTGTMAGVTIGWGSVRADPRSWDGDIARIIGYAGAVTLEQCAAKEDELMTYYGITAPALGITTPRTNYTMQRTGTSALVTFRGVYSLALAPDTIEYRLDAGSWVALSPTLLDDGTWSAAATIAQGQYAVSIRATDGANTATYTFARLTIGDIFAVIGQSNAAGHFDNHQVQSHPTLTATLFAQDSDEWEVLEDPTDHLGDGDDGSPWPVLASLIMERTGVPAGFITAATGGTTLVAGSANWAPGGSAYLAAVTAIQGAAPNRIAYFLWHQGESDAIAGGVSTAQYKTALSAMLDSLQAALGSSAKLVCAQIGTDTTTSTRANLDAIRLAQSELPDDDADVLPGPLTYDMAVVGVHFESDAEAQRLAERWERMLAYAAGESSEGRGPQFASAAKVDSSHIDVAFTLDGTSTLVVGASPTTGWLVKEGGSSRTVTGVALQTATTLRLTVSGSIAGTVTVTYGSYNDGNLSTIVDDGDYPLPPVPFNDEAVS